ncbi:MAG: type II toxin-antitoxin system VapC family toxin [Limisphaerales bacterium]
MTTAMVAAGEMYLDSAIIVKLLIREPDSAFFDTALSGHVLDSSELCLTEVCSALLAKERSGSITANERQKATDQFRNLVQSDILRLFPMNSRTLSRAAAILEACHPRVALRTLDALHVATCDLHQCDILCTTDARMRSAGAHFAMKLFPNDLEKAEK